MNIIEKSGSIRVGLRKGFQDGTFKTAQRRCYGYDTGSDGKLAINPSKTATVRWIFDCCISGDSLSTIAAGLEEQDIPSPADRPKWNREAIRCCPRRPPAQVVPKSKMTASWIGICTSIPMKPLFLTKCSGRCSRTVPKDDDPQREPCGLPLIAASVPQAVSIEQTIESAPAEAEV